MLRTLPKRARRRLPLRLRNPMRIVGTLLALGAIAVGLVVLIGHKAHRGSGSPPIVQNQGTPGSVARINLGAGAEHAYDPYGDNKTEHPDQVAFVYDDDPTTTWSTETYSGGNLGKKGVGLYLGVKPAIIPARLDLRTTTPGMAVEVYGAQSGPPQSLDTPGWTKLGASASVKHKDSIKLSPGDKRYRYILLWITKLPPGGEKATIAELVLYRSTQ